jgi:putative hemolysin
MLMGKHFSATREISYAITAKTLKGRMLIRTVENATGRLKLIRKARGYAQEVADGRNFWDVVPDKYKISLDVISGSLDNIPKSGPVIVLANHPFGILDGLMLGQIMSRSRGDFRILAHKVFSKADDINDNILPISFDETREAMSLNLQTRREALNLLHEGGAVGVFPGGSVSSPRRMFGFPMDPAWRTFTAKMIARSNATVVPVFFEGHNSRRFQIFGRLNKTMRTALLINEFKRRINRPVRVAIGEPLDSAALSTYAKDPAAMMDFLRTKTYDLSSKPINTEEYGYDF